MQSLSLNGVSVSSSELSQTSYRAAPCGLLLNVTPENQANALKVFRTAGFAGPYSGLRISGVTDLGFLQDIPDTLYLEIRSDKPIKTSALEPLSNLRGLYFESPGAGIDFSWFPHLEIYRGGWHKGHVHFDHCPSLRRLALRRFNPESRDLSSLANCRRLESLDIVRSKIVSLDAVETLEDLRVLEIAYMPSLESLDAFEKSDAGLRILAIESAKKIKSYKPMGSLTRLKDLRLFNCAAIPDLKWTQGMNWLENFAFVETNVVDGNLDPLLALERLRYIGCEDKRHYNHKMHDFIEMLANR